MDKPAFNGARREGAAWLAQALRESRADTLSTFAAYERALPGFAVPHRESLNPPLWELGHIGWFQEYWLARNPAWRDGERADPLVPRRAGVRADADDLYNSSEVVHARRWELPMPGADVARAELQAQLDATLALLAEAGDDPDALYFFRLALFHEDMHHEAALYMAQHLGFPVPDPRWQAPVLPDAPAPLIQDAGTVLLGHVGTDFAFDNERGAHRVALGETAIDAQVLRWDAFLPFVEAGAYREPRWWTPAGLAWLGATGAVAPRYLRREGSQWQARRAGRWEPIDPSRPACHLTLFEAQAWCRWANRRLPTEAEWERAALASGPAFRWGDVWEWTASPFGAYPGFVPHPYRDYSAPWFASRQVLRGASFMTQPRMRDVRYRNFFQAHRNDVAAGFRSCKV